MALDKFLRDQAIRLRRTKWQNPWDLADELFLILRGIDVETTGPISIIPPGGGDPVDFPPIDDLNIPPFDFDLPENGAQQPEVDVQDNGNGTSATIQSYFWHRAIFPGQVQSQSSGEQYNIRIYPNGNLTSLSNISGVGTKTVVARLTDPSLAGTVSNNSWVFVYWVAEYLVTELIIRNAQGAIIERTTEVKIVQDEYLFNAPAESGGGKVARVTQTITAREGTTMGQGKAILYMFAVPTDDPNNPGEQTDPLLTAGNEVDVFNSVTSEIAAGADKFIQVKRIDNAWFIDVEDCASGDEESA